MDRERYERIREVYERVLGVAPVDRGRELDDACSGDAELRREVEALLASGERTLGVGHLLATSEIEARREVMEGLIDREGGTSGTRSSGDARQEGVTLAPGTVVGRFRIERVLGVGGMGTVYAAVQARPSRTVALKLIRPGFATAKMLRRFEVEAEILGLLSHPGIARIYDAGVAETPFGTQPYFAMELIEGVLITEFAERRGLGARDRLGLIASIGDAVEHAHQKGVIHRDLKPGNILVGADGQPRVLDFGVARATDADINTATMRTDVGMLVGTLAYMSPEQASGEPNAVDTRSDVYTLGMVAYELLAGRLPYSVEGTMIHEAVTIIRDASPSSLSTVDRSLRGDVETIVGKALAKDKERRYQSAADFAEDIRRYLASEPISARPPSAAYQLRVFARRNKPLVIGGGLFLLALIGGIIGTTAFAFRAERARAEAQRALDDLEVVSDYQSGQLALIDPEQMGIRLAESLRRERERALADAGEPPERIAAELAELRAKLAGVNFTEIASESLRENVFDVAVADIESRFADRPLIASGLLAGLAQTMFKLGLSTEGRAARDRAIELRAAHLGETHPDTLALYAIGILRNNANTSPESAQRVYELLSESLPPEDERVIDAQLHLAMVLASAADTRCLTLTAEAVDAATRGHGPDAEITLRARYFQLRVAIMRLSIRSTTDDAAIQQRGSLLAYGDSAPVDETRRLLADIQRALGDEHDLASLARELLNQMLYRAGRFEEALALIEPVLEERTRRLGSMHWLTVDARQMRAALLEELGRLEEAASELERIIVLREQTYSWPGWTAWEMFHNLGFIRFRQGRYGEAEALLAESLAQRGEDMWHKRNLAMVRVRMGKLDEGEALARETLAEAIEKRPGDWLVGHARGVVGVALIARGRYAEAERELTLAYDEVRAGLGPEHEKTRRVAGFLVELYEAWEEAEPGGGYAEQADEWRARLEEGGE